MKQWLSKAALAAAILTAAAGHAEDPCAGEPCGAIERVREVTTHKHPAWLTDALVHEIHSEAGSHLLVRDGQDPFIPGAPVVTVRDQEEARADDDSQRASQSNE